MPIDSQTAGSPPTLGGCIHKRKTWTLAPHFSKHSKGSIASDAVSAERSARITKRHTTPFGWTNRPPKGGSQKECRSRDLSAPVGCLSKPNHPPQRTDISKQLLACPPPASTLSTTLKISISPP